jgi:hypothetical protein
MPRFTMTFYANEFDQLQINATQKQIPIAQYVRDLVAIGLRVEDAAAKKTQDDNTKKSEIDELGDVKKLWESDLSWLLESLYLTRYLVRHLMHNANLSLEDNQSHLDDIINRAKDKAQSYVNGLLCKGI